MQAGFTIAMALGARKAQKKLLALADDVRLHALPVIIQSRELIQDFSPKFKVITENLTAASTTLRSKTEQVGGLVGDVTGRAQAQATRVDGMVKAHSISSTSPSMPSSTGCCAPSPGERILNGLRAGVEVLRKKSLTTTSNQKTTSSSNEQKRRL